MMFSQIMTQLLISKEQIKVCYTPSLSLTMSVRKKKKWQLGYPAVQKCLISSKCCETCLFTCRLQAAG